MNLQKKLFLTYILLALIPLGILGSIVYINVYKTLINVQQNSVAATADIKVIVIKNYLERFKNEILLTKDRFIIKTNFPILQKFKDQSEKKEYTDAYTLLDTQMVNLKNTWKEMDAVLLTNNEGEIIYANPPEYIGKSINDIMHGFGTNAFKQGQNGIHISDTHKNTTTGSVDFLISAPMYDSNNKAMGVLIFDINTERLFDNVMATDKVQQTVETIIAKKTNDTMEQEGYPFDENGNIIIFLNQMRSDGNVSTNRQNKIGGTRGIPIQNAIKGLTGQGVSIDYKNNQVISAWRFIPETNWGLVTKMNLSEAITPLKTTGTTLLIITLIIFISTIILAKITSGTIISPIKQLTKLAIKVGEGNLNTSFNDASLLGKDEVGILAKTLSDTTIKLKDMYENMDKKVQEKTAKLEQSEKKLQSTLIDTEHLNKQMVDRELKMIELKKKLTDLQQK